MQAEKIPKFDATIISDLSLEEIPKLLRKVSSLITAFFMANFA
jgi:hypothetical protein